MRILLLALFAFSCARSNPASTPAPASMPGVPPARAQAPAAAPAPTPARKPEAFALKAVSLYNYRNREIAGRADEEITKRNDSDIAAFTAFVPEIRKSTNSGGELSYSAAQAVLSALNDNPVASPYESKYQRPDVKIGYCFGRATFIHIALKKMGLQTSSIRKVWIVGPMHAGTVDWGFHVAPAAFVKGRGWMMLDSNLGYPIGVRDWFHHYLPMSTDGRLRIYFTMPTRFGVTIPKYDRVDLGFNLPEEKDWYSHYFVDMMAWFRKTSLAEMGLAKVAPAVESTPPQGSDIY